MIISEDIFSTVFRYLQRFPDEEIRLAPLTEALQLGGGLTARTELPGHVTCTAAVVDPAGEVLLVRHRLLQRWFMPGGHLEPGDRRLIDAARREGQEEARLPTEHLLAWAGFDQLPVDIDIHPIPANPARQEAAHLHYDFRWLFSIDHRPVVTVQAEEVTAFAWRPIAQIEDELIRAKIESLYAAAARPLTVH